MANAFIQAVSTGTDAFEDNVREDDDWVSGGDRELASLPDALDCCSMFERRINQTVRELKCVAEACISAKTTLRNQMREARNRAETSVKAEKHNQEQLKAYVSQAKRMLDASHDAA